ncbi:hypothetical protein FHR90_003448 [Endobacter medicaginis]|uniref:Antitoxin VbhA domain-containing protein n=2 Tax=Endobacter medicaginis TaxID=1181271 RepID=A0A850NTJ9_9PROT|nr:hypothetical protein [Endobacter medicaginis]MBB3175586.1 hypothetical protein [Endobacter medicaginis]MCX5476266.1 hypothetical protein [Endobacter medicaginis]NVN30732.1 hypothetical protein [Endobacter medicaginis]
MSAVITELRITAQESARRQRMIDNVIAAQKRQGYVYDAVIEDAAAAYVRGEIDREGFGRAMRQGG